MAFPDDYKRVQQPGGAKAIVEAAVFLARQLGVNTDDWTLLLGDGSTAGGHRVLMEANFNAFMQGNAPFGTKAYIEAGTDGLTVELARIWKASELASTFAKLADIATPGAWFIKDSAMPDTMRGVAKSLADANNALTDGFYRFDPATAANLPAGIPATGPWHMMIVIAHSTQNLVQTLWLRDGSGEIYTRSLTDGVWQSWVQSTGVTLADLNTKVSKAGDTMTGALTLKAGTAASPSLKQPDGVAPTTPADGDIWREDANGGLRFRKGSTTRTVKDTHNSAFAIINDTKPNATAGGASLANTWQTRNLNTELYDPENIVTISSNQFTVAFDCECHWSAPIYAVKNFVSRLYNVTDGVVVSYGSTGYTEDTSNVTAFTEGFGIVTSGKTYRIETNCLLAVATGLGGGATAASAASSIFTQVYLKRI